MPRRRKQHDGIICRCGGVLRDVLDSRSREGFIWRRRACASCGARVTTEEKIRPSRRQDELDALSASNAPHAEKNQEPN